MIRITLKSIFSALLLLLAQYGYCEYAVIVNAGNKTPISKEDLANIYLAKAKAFPDGKLAIPLNQTNNTQAKSHFDLTILGKTDSQIRAYWSRLIFTGKAVPIKEVENDAEVLELVEKNPSAIGYIDASKVNTNVKVLFTY